MDPIEAEKQLFAAVETGDTALVGRTLEGLGRDALEFTGRCFAHAIMAGDTETALLLGRAGCCLNVADEPTVKALLDSGAAGMRGLAGFLQKYRYCHAQRTYYLPIVDSVASIEPVRALLAQGQGFTEHDQAELLSLAIRQDNVEMARTLADDGAHLIDDIHDAVPDDLLGKAGVRNEHSPWIEQVSPRSSLEMIGFLLDRANGAPCPIRASWFKLYFRDPQFTRKLALIAPRSNAALCENAPALLEALERDGHARAADAVLAWDGLDEAALSPALAAAQSAGHIDIAAAILDRIHASAPRVEPLAF